MRSVEYVGTACALDVNVNKARGDYSPLCVKFVVKAGGGIDPADLSDGAIFD